MVELHRILVALDDESQGEAVHAANELARACGATVRGLFVEDINLVRAAQLGCLHEIGHSLVRSEHSLEHLERKLRAKAALIQRHFLKLAQLLQAEVDFAVARGVVAEEILRAQQGMDLLLLGMPLIKGRRMLFGGATTRAVLERATGPVLFFPGKYELGKELLVISDISSALPSVVEQARKYAALFQRRIKILVVGGNAATPVALPTGENEEVILLPGWQALYQYLALNRHNLLVLPGSTSILEHSGLMYMLQGIGMPMLFIREHQQETVE